MGREKRKKFEVGYLVQIQVQEKAPVQLRCFSIKRDIKVDDLFNSFEDEHAKGIPPFLAPATYRCFQHGVGHSG